MIARIVIWNLFNSKTNLDEVREHLPLLPEGDYWISNEAADRFGVVSFGEVMPDLDPIPGLIGDEPVVAEEFDILE